VLRCPICHGSGEFRWGFRGRKFVSECALCNGAGRIAAWRWCAYWLIVILEPLLHGDEQPYTTKEMTDD